MSQLCGSHACAWPCSPLTGTPDPDPESDHPGTSSLWTCPSIWTTSDFIFARPALLFENCGTAPYWGGHGSARQAGIRHHNPCPCGAAHVAPDRKSLRHFVLCCSHRKGTDFSSQSSQSFYQTSLPKCLHLLAFVPFVSGSNIV